MTVQDEWEEQLGVALWEAMSWLDLGLCDYLMSQLIIGQREKRDMGIYVYHIFYMRMKMKMKWIVANDKENGGDDDDLDPFSYFLWAL